ncbi:Myotubularin-related protein 2 [Balamuthia mandrillaris]
MKEPWFVEAFCKDQPRLPFGLQQGWSTPSSSFSSCAALTLLPGEVLLSTFSDIYICSPLIHQHHPSPPPPPPPSSSSSSSSSPSRTTTAKKEGEEDKDQCVDTNEVKVAHKARGGDGDEAKKERLLLAPQQPKKEKQGIAREKKHKRSYSDEFLFLNASSSSSPVPPSSSSSSSPSSPVAPWVAAAPLSAPPPPLPSLSAAASSSLPLRTIHSMHLQRERRRLVVRLKDVRVLLLHFPLLSATRKKGQKATLLEQVYNAVMGAIVQQHLFALAFHEAVLKEVNPILPTEWQTTAQHRQYNLLQECLHRFNITSPSSLSLAKKEEEASASPQWRITSINSNFELCPSYPPLLVVPAAIADAELWQVAKYRQKSRIPVLVWLDVKTGVALCRSSQPLSGLLGNRCVEDEKLVQHIITPPPSPHHSYQRTLVILDARPRMNALLNRAKGGGYERTSQYNNVRQVQFLGCPNVHRIRESFFKFQDFLLAVIESKEEQLMEPLIQDSTVSFHLSAPSSSASMTASLLAPPASTMNSRHQRRRSWSGSVKETIASPSSEEDREPTAQNELKQKERTEVEEHQETKQWGWDWMYGKWASLRGRLRSASEEVQEEKEVDEKREESQKGKEKEQIRDKKKGRAFTTTTKSNNPSNAPETDVVGNNIFNRTPSLNSSSVFSVDSLKKLLQEESIEWFAHCYRLLMGAACAVAQMRDHRLSYLVHCTDGWDRTTQLCSLMQLMLDPHYRTMEGFHMLIEKDWLCYGHQFHLRCGHGGISGSLQRKQSPIFLQFLDCVWQLLQQFPFFFEFNDTLLLFLADSLYEGQFGDFLGNSERDRQRSGIAHRTLSLWDSVEANRSLFLNPHFRPSPTSSLSDCIVPMEANKWYGRRLWSSFYLRWMSLSPMEVKKVEMALEERIQAMLLRLHRQEEQAQAQDPTTNNSSDAQHRHASLRPSLSSTALLRDNEERKEEFEGKKLMMPAFETDNEYLRKLPFMQKTNKAINVPATWGYIIDCNISSYDRRNSTNRRTHQVIASYTDAIKRLQTGDICLWSLTKAQTETYLQLVNPSSSLDAIPSPAFVRCGIFIRPKEVLAMTESSTSSALYSWKDTFETFLKERQKEIKQPDQTLKRLERTSRSYPTLQRRKEHLTGRKNSSLHLGTTIVKKEQDEEGTNSGDEKECKNNNSVEQEMEWEEEENSWRCVEDLMDHVFVWISSSKGMVLRPLGRYLYNRKWRSRIRIYARHLQVERTPFMMHSLQQIIGRHLQLESQMELLALIPASSSSSSSSLSASFRREKKPFHALMMKKLASWQNDHQPAEGDERKRRKNKEKLEDELARYFSAENVGWILDRFGLLAPPHQPKITDEVKDEEAEWCCSEFVENCTVGDMLSWASSSSLPLVDACLEEEVWISPYNVHDDNENETEQDAVEEREKEEEGKGEEEEKQQADDEQEQRIEEEDEVKEEEYWVDTMVTVVEARDMCATQVFCELSGRSLLEDATVNTNLHSQHSAYSPLPQIFLRPSSQQALEQLTTTTTTTRTTSTVTNLQKEDDNKENDSNNKASHHRHSHHAHYSLVWNETFYLGRCEELSLSCFQPRTTFFRHHHLPPSSPSAAPNFRLLGSIAPIDLRELETDVEIDSWHEVRVLVRSSSSSSSSSSTFASSFSTTRGYIRLKVQKLSNPWHISSFRCLYDASHLLPSFHLADNAQTQTRKKQQSGPRGSTAEGTLLSAPPLAVLSTASADVLLGGVVALAQAED